MGLLTLGLFLAPGCSRSASYWVEQDEAGAPHYVIECSPKARGRCWARAGELCGGHYQIIEQAKRHVRVQCVER